MSGILRGAVSKALPVAKTNITQKATIVSGPPKYKVTFMEKIGLGTFMCFATISPAAWVLSHLQQYKKRAGGEGEE